MLINIARMGIQGEGLINLCRKIKEKEKKIERILEIGSYAGDSSLIFKSEFPDAILFCVDPWVNGYDPNDSASYLYPMAMIEELYNQKFLGVSKVVKVKLTADEFFEIIPDNYFDLVYIDGCHKYDYVKRDILNSIKKLKVGGILAGHDFVKEEHLIGVYKAVLDTLGIPDEVFADNSWIFWNPKNSND